MGTHMKKDEPIAHPGPLPPSPHVVLSGVKEDLHFQPMMQA